jgi:hypothetical protein
LFILALSFDLSCTSNEFFLVVPVYVANDSISPIPKLIENTEPVVSVAINGSSAATVILLVVAVYPVITLAASFAPGPDVIFTVAPL